MKTIDILQKYSDIFTLDTIIWRAIRELCWGLVKILAYIVDAISAVTDKLFVMDSFYNNPDVIKYIDSFKPLIVVLFGVSFCVIGYQLMYSQDKRFKQIAINLIVAIAVIIVLPEAMNKMNDITNAGVTAVNGKPSNMANQIIKSNTVDLLVYDKANFNEGAIKQLTSGNEISVDDIRYIDSTALVEPDFFNSMGIQNTEVFKKRLTLGENGKKDTEDLNQGWMTWWKDYYYRYDINFLNIIVALAVTGATLVFTCFKLGTLIFELGYNKLLAIIVAPADIGNGQKTKKIIENIVSIFIVTFLIAVLLKFYVLFVAMCTSKKGMVWLVLMVSGSYAVMDGPNIVQKLFGIDAGLSSGLDTMMGAYMVGKALNKTGKAANQMGKTVKNAATSGARTVGGMAGGAVGIAKGLNGDDKKQDKGLYKDMDKDKAKMATNSTGSEESIYDNKGVADGSTANKESNDEKNIDNGKNSKPIGGDSDISKLDSDQDIDENMASLMGTEGRIPNQENDLYEEMGKGEKATTGSIGSLDGNNESSSVAPKSLHQEMENRTGDKSIGSSNNSNPTSGGSNISKPEENAPIDENMASLLGTEGSIGNQETGESIYQNMGQGADNLTHSNPTSGGSNISKPEGDARIDENMASFYGTEGSIGNQETGENLYQNMGQGADSLTHSNPTSGGSNISMSEGDARIDENMASFYGTEGSIGNQGTGENIYQNMGQGADSLTHSNPTSGGNNSNKSGNSGLNNSNKNINVNNNNKQTIGGYTKSKLKGKIQNNDVYKQTMKSYNLGKNTGESIRNRNAKNTDDKK